MHYNLTVAWDVEVTDEFKTWWDGFTEAERISVERFVLLLNMASLLFAQRPLTCGQGYARDRRPRLPGRGRACPTPTADAQLLMTLCLEERGPHLPFPYSSAVNGSRHAAMHELRVQHQGRPYRVL